MTQNKQQLKQTDLADMLRRACALHQRGQLPEAEALYAAVLAAQPNNFDALHLLGVLKHQLGQNAEALALIARPASIRRALSAAQPAFGI